VPILRKFKKRKKYTVREDYESTEQQALPFVNFIKFAIYFSSDDHGNISSKSLKGYYCGRGQKNIREIAFFTKL